MGSAEFMLLVLRLLLVVVAVTAGIVACLTVVGCITGLVQGETFQCVGDWIVFVVVPLVLAPLSVCLFYLARSVRRIERSRSPAASEGSPGSDVVCPQCQSDTLVKGPRRTEWLFRARHVARCLTCGEHLIVPRRVWEGLPRPQLGDPHETFDDKLDLMRHYPMTAGHGVCTVLGAVAAFAAAFYLSLAWDLSTPISAAVFLALIFGAWWLGYLLFPARRRPGQRCAKCGYDLRACTAPRCPECGTPFDPRQVKLRIARPREPDKPG